VLLDPFHPGRFALAALAAVITLSKPVLLRRMYQLLSVGL